MANNSCLALSGICCTNSLIHYIFVAILMVVTQNNTLCFVATTGQELAENDSYWMYSNHKLIFLCFLLTALINPLLHLEFSLCQDHINYFTI